MTPFERIAHTAAIAWFALALFAALGVPADRADAAEIEGVTFAEDVVAEGTELDIFGVGLMRYRYFIKAYVAALYLPAGASATEVFDDSVPRQLVIHYFYSIAGDGFGAAAGRILEGMLATEQVAALKPRLDQIAGLYVDVEPGDRYSLTYLPGIGTELAFNGTPLGTIPGADFAAEYFKIWLGEKPISGGLRSQLLKLG